MYADFDYLEMERLKWGEGYAFLSLLNPKWTFYVITLIEILWSDLTFKQQSSRIYCSAGTPVLLLSRPEYSEVALESGKSGNFVA